MTAEDYPTNPPEPALRHVSGISWPRSGHHLLVRLLTGYFGARFVYCEFHQGHPTDESLGGCCRQMPCAHGSRVTLSKNHDFNLDVPQIPGHHYLLQTRAFEPSVVSNFELAVRGGRKDSADSFRRFVSSEFTYFRSFREKWVTSAFGRSKDVLHLPYEDLISDTQAVLALAIRHIAPDHVPDTERMRAVIAQVDAQKVAARKVEVIKGAGVHASRKVEAFRYYDPVLFAQMARLQLTRYEVEDEFQRLLGRPPAEANMLAFQGIESREALAARLRASPEFKARHADAPSTPNNIPESSENAFEKK